MSGTRASVTGLSAAHDWPWLVMLFSCPYSGTDLELAMCALGRSHSVAETEILGLRTGP